MSKIPVRDQGEFASCYAHAAAGLVDAYRFSHGDHRVDLQTSALMAAVEYAQDGWLKDSDITSGHACPVVDHLNKAGACSAFGVRDRWSNDVEVYVRQFIRWQNEIVARTSVKSKILDSYRWLQGVPIHVREQTSARIYAEQVCQALADQGFPATSLPFVADLEPLLRQKAPAALLDALRKGLCSGKNHFSLRVPACHSRYRLTPSTTTIRRTLNSRLDLSNAQPVEILYCAEVLTEGRRFNPFSIPELMFSGCARHSSLVIGRRKNPNSGRCEYRVRNSWGTSCFAYSSDWTCDSGNIWVDAESLERSVFSVSFLE